MSSYNPNIPQGPDIISKSQPQLKNNFGSLNTAFSVDHFPFNEPDSAKFGHHKKIIFPEGQSVDPNLAAGAGSSLYTKKIGSLFELFFQNDASPSAVKQLTDLTINSQANAGSAGGTIYTIDTPWGLRIYCGGTNNVSGVRYVTFPTSLNAMYCYLGTPSSGQTNSGSYTCEATTSGSLYTGLFFWVQTGGIRTFSYFVLGKL